jgi:hypothetical protein
MELEQISMSLNVIVTGGLDPRVRPLRKNGLPGPAMTN